MNVEELLTRFPEIPRDLAEEPILAEYAEVFDGMLCKAAKPTPCIKSPDAPHVFYTTLVIDMAIYGMRLAKRDKTLARLREKLDQFRRNPVKFGCGLIPSKPRGTPVAGCPS